MLSCLKCKNQVGNYKIILDQIAKYQQDRRVLIKHLEITVLRRNHDQSVIIVPVCFVQTVGEGTLKIKISNQHSKTLFRNMQHSKVTWITTTHLIIISVNRIINLGVSQHLQEMIELREV